MIRISMGGVRITTRTTDKWNREVVYWQVTPWGYVGFDMYCKLMNFEYNQASVWPDGFDTELLIKQKLESMGSQGLVYQFNAVSDPANVNNARKNPFIRMVAVLHNTDHVNRLKYVPWFDAYIKYPVYKAVCAVANKVLS